MADEGRLATSGKTHDAQNLAAIDVKAHARNADNRAEAGEDLFLGQGVLASRMQSRHRVSTEDFPDVSAVNHCILVSVHLHPFKYRKNAAPVPPDRAIGRRRDAGFRQFYLAAFASSSQASNCC